VLAVVSAVALLAVDALGSQTPPTGTAFRAVVSVVAAFGLWFGVRLLDLLVWERLLPWRTGVRIPRLLRQLVAVLLGVVVLTVLLGRVWDLAVGPVLAATGAVGIVMGLALRNVLADFFSGIALNMEHPFRLDDFVLLHVRTRREPVAGFVREINWRSTTVLTPEDNLISVPNSVVAESTVENLSYPSPVYELELDVLLDWHLEPAVLEPVLTAAVLDAWVRGATSGDKPPKTRMVRMDGAGVIYRIVYLIDPRRKPKGPARHLLLSCLQTHLKHAGLRPVLEAQALAGTPLPPQRPMDPAREEDRLIALSQVAVLGALNGEELLTLASAVRVCRVAMGEDVVRQGDAGRSMFVVAAGVLEVLQASAADSAPQRVSTLSPGQFFGEMSLLTEVPRTATVRALGPALLYEVPPEHMEALLQARPALADALGAVAAERLKRDAQAAQALKALPPGRRGGLAEAVADAMRRLFGA
jgi:CRP-like cAMP-binding protein/putative flippase GtrA